MAKGANRNYSRYYKTKSSYKRYVALYDRKAKVLANKGYSMFDKKYTFTEYKTMVMETRNTLKERVKAGKIKRMPSVFNSLINKQAYKLSEEQAYSIFDFIKENKEKYDIDTSFIKNINNAIMKIRQGDWLTQDVGLFNMIKDYRKEAFEKYKLLADKDPDKLTELYAEFSTDKEPINTISGLVRKEVARTFYGSP